MLVVIQCEISLYLRIPNKREKLSLFKGLMRGLLMDINLKYKARCEVVIWHWVMERHNKPPIVVVNKNTSSMSAKS